MLQKLLEEKGLKFYLNEEISEFIGEHEVTGVRLKSGKLLSCNMAIVAIGIIPNSEIGLEAGLDGRKGILVDDYMQSSSPNISALGECIEHHGQTFGLVDPLWRQAKTLALRLADNKKQAFINSAIATKLKVSGVQLFSAGEVENQEGMQALTVEDHEAKIYRKLLIQDGYIKGIVLFGDVSSGPYYFDLMQENINVESLLPNLIFGQQFIDSQSLNTHHSAPD